MNIFHVALSKLDRNTLQTSMWDDFRWRRRNFLSLSQDMFTHLKLICSTKPHMPYLHSDTWHTNWVYKVSYYTFINSNLSRRTNLLLAHVHIETAHAVKLYFSQLSILKRVALRKHSREVYSNVQVSCWTRIVGKRGKCTKFILTRVKLYKFSFDNWETV